MEVKFIPLLCKPVIEDEKEVSPALFEGHISLRMPTFKERYESVSALDITVDREGNVKDDTIKIDMIIKLVEYSKKFYKEVCIKKLKDGTEYKSFEDLEMDPECDQILMDVAKEIRSGFKPSKN